MASDTPITTLRGRCTDWGQSNKHFALLHGPLLMPGVNGGPAWLCPCEAEPLAKDDSLSICWFRACRFLSLREQSRVLLPDLVYSQLPPLQHVDSKKQQGKTCYLQPHHKMRLRSHNCRSTIEPWTDSAISLALNKCTWWNGTLIILRVGPLATRRVVDHPYITLSITTRHYHGFPTY